MSRRDAICALRDCGVIRAPYDHRAFSELVLLGLADAKPFSQHEDDHTPRRDFRLTTQGDRTAKVMFA